MRRILAGAIAAVCLSPITLRAEVVRFDIVERQPAFAGRSFGDVGPYERITARATIALDPSDDRNAVITDLAQAPRNPEGKVEATADVVILRPADPARGNGTLLLDVPNRGRKLAPQLFDDLSQPGANNAQSADDAGIGFLHRQGYTMVWVGWQGDIPSRPGQMALTAPVLKSVTGPAREEFIFDTTTNPARATLTWPAADPANLTSPFAPPGPTRARRRQASRPASSIPQPSRSRGPTASMPARSTRSPTRRAIRRRSAWALPRCAMSQASCAAIRRRPIRCSTACIRPSAARSASASRNPAASCATSSISASTRISPGRVVFDGLMPHVAGTRRMATNVRFGLPGRNPRHPQDPAWQADLFPFTYATLSDPISGKTDGLLRRCALSVTCPKVMQTDSEHEWWASRASLLVTDLAGNHLDLPDNVRAYMIAGTPHFADPADVMRKSRGCDVAAAKPCSCRRADARAVDRSQCLDQRWRPAAGKPRADARPWHAGRSRRRGAHRYPRPVLQGHPYARPPSPTRACCRPRRSAVIPCSCRRRTTTAWRYQAFASLRLPCRARPTRRGIHARKVLGRPRCIRCRAPWCRLRRPKRHERKYTTRGRRLRSVMRITTPMSPRCVARLRGKWPSGCCCPRMRSVPSRPRSKGSWRSSGSKPS